MAIINLKVRLTRKRKKDLSRVIDTVGLLCHIVTGDLVSPGPTSSADFPELTSSAFPTITIGIPEILENLRGGPDCLERGLPHIPAVQFEIAAGLDLTHVRDETERDAPQTPAGHGIQSILFWGDLLALFLCLLPKDTVIVRGAGGFELERDPFSLLVKPVEGFLIFQGRDLLVPEVFSPSRGNEKEDMMGYCTQVNRKLEDLFNQGEVRAGDRGVDLEFEGHFLCDFEPLE